MQLHVVYAALACLAILAGLGAFHGASLAAAAFIGGAAGFALYHASFGFTAAWRRFARERRGGGLRAQMLLIGLTSLITFPLMTYGQQIGIPAAGNILPMGVASALGAFVFGVGMQIGGGCASGTLFTSGGGSTRMLVVLFFFVLGSIWSTASYDVWGNWPTLNDNRGVSLIGEFGLGGAMLAMALALGAIALLSAAIERRAHGGLEPQRRTGSLLTGPWSLVAGAVALAGVGVATMAVTGRPWGVTWGFAIWGAHGAEALGVDVRSWTYWGGWRTGVLDQGLFGVPTSIMNFGIIFGAMAAAGLAGRWSPTRLLSAREIVTATIGGLLMGWGARMAYGCNIGAFLGGLVSGSLHGWWWLLWGYLGSSIGVRVRVLLSMDPPMTPRAA